MRYTLIFAMAGLCSACTQPAVTVENRGANYYGKSGASVVTASAPMAPVTETAPMETATIANSTIAVHDLTPAAGKMEDTPPNAWTDGLRASPKEAVSVTTRGPYIWPTDSHSVIAEFGPKGAGKTNDGLNISAKKGEPVWAAADGEVVYADSKLKGYGNMVIVKHAGGKTTSYAHLARLAVDKYDRVKQGDIIGYVGTTGNVKEPQLYFSVREGTTPVNPQKYVGNSVAGV